VGAFRLASALTAGVLAYVGFARFDADRANFDEAMVWYAGALVCTLAFAWEGTLPSVRGTGTLAALFGEGPSGIVLVVPPEREAALRALAAEHDTAVWTLGQIGGDILEIAPVLAMPIDAVRRAQELEEKGAPQPYAQVFSEMERRDHDDRNRADSPLTQDDRYIVIDSADKEPEEVVAEMERLIRQTSRDP
jgi:hypothetical protein